MSRRPDRQRRNYIPDVHGEEADLRYGFALGKASGNLERKGRLVTYNIESLGWIRRSILLMLVLTQATFPQSNGRTGARPPKNLSGAQQSSRFIVAFELSPERGFTFTWPLESMRAAPYETVLMVIERMPRVFYERSKGRKSQPLVASRHLKINGRLQRPLRSRGGNERESNEEFLVKLDQGRLRLALAVPPGVSLDPPHRKAGIRLYQVNRASMTGPSSEFFVEFLRTIHQAKLSRPPNL